LTAETRAVTPIASGVLDSGPSPKAGASELAKATASVAIVPGLAFRTPDWVRISYAAEQSLVLEACRRVARLADVMAGTMAVG
jgi:aspartate/methionine/tyrosine aminotransferase